MYIEDFGNLQIRSIWLTISTTRHTDRMCGSMRAATLPPAAMCSITTAVLSSTIPGGRIPDEHKVFSMPKLNIREQMAAYKEVIDRSSLEGERLHPRKEVPER